jgi:hypothetical protein
MITMITFRAEIQSFENRPRGNFAYKYVLILVDVFHRGRDSSVGIATCYGLDGLGIESRRGARRSTPVQTGPGGPRSLLYSGYRVFSGVKAAWPWR